MLATILDHFETILGPNPDYTTIAFAIAALTIIIMFLLFMLPRKYIWMFVWIGFISKNAAWPNVAKAGWALASFALVALVIKSLDRPHKTFRKVKRDNRLIVLYLVLSVVSLAYSNDRIASFQALATTLVCWVAVYGQLSQQQSLTHSFQECFYGIPVVSILMIALNGVYALTSPSKAFGPSGRFQGVLLGPNYLASSVASMIIALCILLHIYKGRKRVPWCLWIIVAGLVVLQIAIINRAGILLGLGALAAYMVYTPKGRGNMFILITILVVGVLLLFPTSLLRDRFITSGLTGRWRTYEIVFQEGLKYPIFGHGYGLVKWIQKDVPNFTLGSHNWMLSIFYNLGTVGCAIAAAIVGQTLYYGVKHSRVSPAVWYSKFALCVFSLALIASLFEGFFWEGGLTISLITILFMFVLRMPPSVSETMEPRMAMQTRGT